MSLVEFGLEQCSIESVKEDKARWDMPFAYAVSVHDLKTNEFSTHQVSGKKVIELAEIIESLPDKKNLDMRIYYKN